MADRVDAVVNLSKRRGFVFPSSEIDGGTRSAWDYGPLGVELKENIKRQWWQAVVRGRDDVVGLLMRIIGMVFLVAASIFGRLLWLDLAGIALALWLPSANKRQQV